MTTPTQWTTRTPTVAGWYWWQPTYSSPEVVLLSDLGGLRLNKVACRDVQPLPTSGRWCGPLPEPK